MQKEPGMWTKFVSGAAEAGAKIAGPAADAFGAIPDALDRVTPSAVKTAFSVALAELYMPPDLSNMLEREGVAQTFDVTIEGQSEKIKGVAITLKDKQQIIYTADRGPINRETGEHVDIVGNEDRSTVNKAVGRQYYHHVGHAYIPGNSTLEMEKPFSIGQNETVYQFDRQGRLFQHVEAVTGGKKAHWEEIKPYGEMHLNNAKNLEADKVKSLGLPGLPLNEKARGLAHKTGIATGEAVVGGALLALGVVFGASQGIKDLTADDAHQARDDGFWAKAKRTGSKILLAAGALLGISQFIYSVGLKDKLTEKEGYNKPDSLLEFVRDSLERAVKPAPLQVDGLVRE